MKLKHIVIATLFLVGLQSARADDSARVDASARADDSARYFAQLDKNGVVLQVIVVNVTDTLNHGVEDEQTGINFCKWLLGADTRWVQTSADGSLRKNYAAIGGRYDEDLDVFVEPQPLSSWVLNKDTVKWEAPVPRPDDGLIYRWDEDTTSWKRTEKN